MLRTPSSTPDQTLWRTKAPTARPISLEEAKLHLRISDVDTTQDSKVLVDLDASIEKVEHDTERVAINATYESRLKFFPSSGEPIRLDRNPVASVTSLKHRDESGTVITVDPSDYVFDEGHRAIFPNSGEWPTAENNRHPHTVVATFVAGYGPTGASVPAEHLDAILLALTIRFYQEPLEEQYRNLINPLRRSSYP